MTKQKAILLVVALEAALVALAWANHGLTLEALHAVTRYSGRLSLAIFSIIFLLHQEPKRVGAILSNQFFLVFAVAHGIHLAELLANVYLSDIPLVPYRVAGGFLAYAFIFIMPYIQTRFETNVISRSRFQVAELVYLYYVWLIFFMTYLSRVQRGFPGSPANDAVHLTLFTWVCLLLIVFATNIWFRKISRRKSTLDNFDN